MTRPRRRNLQPDEKDVRRLRELDRENARLKRLLAERDLEIDALRELLGKGA